MNREPEHLPQSEDVMTLSFLDVLSCGMGASMCLFLVFSIMPHIGPAAGSSDGRQNGGSQGAASMALLPPDDTRFAAVEIEVRLRGAQGTFMLPQDPWNGALTGPDTLLLRPVEIADGSGQLITEFNSHISSIDKVAPGSIGFHLAPSVAKADTEVNVEVVVFVGGAQIKPDPPFLILKCASLEAGKPIFTVNLAKDDSDNKIKWEEAYARRSPE